jgi:DNA-binding NarL/FixJ family response regulator
LSTFAIPTPISVLVVDDHPIVVEILNAIVRGVFPEANLSAAFGLVEGLASARAAESLDLVLLDLGLPGCEGISALNEFRAALPAVRVVVVSADDSPRVVLAALEAGAAGYIPKTSQSSVIAAALRLIAAGGTYVPLECIESALAPGADEGVAAGASRTALTARQHEVLRLIVRGFANKEIARQLRIAQDTVKQHARAVYAVLGVAGRSQAARAAESRGIKLD